MPATPVVRGTCHALFAFEVGHSVDLDAAERLLAADTTVRQQLKQTRRAPPYFQYRPAPLRASQTVQPVRVGGWTSLDRADAVLYDFGAMQVSYAFPFDGPLDGLVDLSASLMGNTDLLEAARQQARGVLTAVTGAVTKPRIAGLVEDYAVFHVTETDPATGATDLAGAHGQLLARLLRGEPQELSAQEVSDALLFRLSFTERDITIVDWNAALVVDREADETRTVLEFANAQLLELRFLDQELDEDLDLSYQILTAGGLRGWRLLRSHTRNMTHVSTLQADAAVLYERVTNALKLVGDMYLARLYRMVSQRFHMEEWDNSISRKLQTIEGIYQKLADRQESRRLEVLEWIVIILIAGEIVLSLVGH